MTVLTVFRLSRSLALIAFALLYILSPIGNIKSPVGENKFNWRLGISMSGRVELEK